MPDEQHQSAERLLLGMARFGLRVTQAMEAATDQPDLVTNSPILVMSLLDLEGPARPGAISDAIGLTSGGTTKLLDRMEQAGLVERSYGAVESDHRGVVVALTASGRRLLRTATGALLAELPASRELVKQIVELSESIGPGAR